MSRSGYSDGADQWQSIMWRGAVSSAVRGRRGQKFFHELLIALDVMEVKELISDELEVQGSFCTLGALAHNKGIDLSRVDAMDSDNVAEKFDIAPALAREVVYMNDEDRHYYSAESMPARWIRMREWVSCQIIEVDGK